MPKTKYIGVLIVLIGTFLFKGTSHLFHTNYAIPYGITDSAKSKPEVEFLIPTFRGDVKRSFYGNEAPTNLSLIWKLYLGEGVTVISRKLGSRTWAGAGWTGQPLLVKEDTNMYILQGAYDHNLKKINASTGNLIWQYKFDDVVKGTGTIWYNANAESEENKIVILQGSRLGVGNYLDSDHIPSLRCISYYSGKELWRLDVKWTDSYSRDVDGSALVLNDTAYIGLENSLFTVLNPDYRYGDSLNGMWQPCIYQEVPLYTMEDVTSHKNNIVTESSACLLNGVIYVASGSGHIYGYNLKKKCLVWDFFIGSDIDGSAVVTSDSCLIVTIERQYIKGKGGAFKLDPSKNPDDCVVWYFPTENKAYSGWEGGIIGTAAINDEYNDGSLPYLAAFMAIDGNLYVVNHKKIVDNILVAGPDDIKLYHTPQLVYKDKVGPSISSPLLFKDKMISAGYNGIKLYAYDHALNFSILDSVPDVPFEATPVVFNRRLYAASRDGYFYCLGK